MPRQHVFCSFMVCNFYMGFSSGSSRRRREQRRPSESRPTSWAAPCLMYLQFCDRGSPASGGRWGAGLPPLRTASPRGGRRVIQNCLGQHKLDLSRSWFLHLLDRRQPPGKLFAEKWYLQFLRATSLLQECGTWKVPRPNIGIASLRFAIFQLKHCSKARNWVYNKYI